MCQRERPLMMSDLRVGRGVLNDPKKSDISGQKSSDMIGRGWGGENYQKHCISYLILRRI